jgi:hypothetical protein
MTVVREPAVPVQAESTTSEAEDRQPTSTVPGWMKVLAVAPATCLTALGGTALVLAMLGIYRLWLALLIGIPICVVLVVAVIRFFPRVGPVSREGQVVAVLTVVLAAVSLGVYGFHTSQYTAIDADPGSYSTTARWIARDGSLRDDILVGAFKGAPNLITSGPAVYDMGGGHIEFQFNHLTSAAMAVAFGIGGQRALFRLSALVVALSLLPLYVLGCRLLRRPWLAFIVAATFAEALPLIWIGRGTYSEPYTLLPLVAGLIVLCWLWERPRISTAIVAGLLVGTTMMARTDAVVYLVPLVPFGAFLWVRRARRPLAALVLATAVPVAIGLIDLRYLSGRYATDLASRRNALQLGFGLMIVICVVAVMARAWLVRIWGWIVRSPTGIVLGCIATAGFLAGWLLRPILFPAHAGNSAFIAGLQKQEGVTVDGTRNYAEATLRWIGWYFGPFVMVLAAVGLGVLVWRILSGRGVIVDVLLAAYLLFGGALYIWNPEINPFQIWAMRRFVPIVLPGVVLLAGVAIDHLLTLVREWRPSRALLVAVGGVLAAAMLLPTAVASAYDGDIKEQAGFLQVFEATCAHAGPDGVLLVTGAYGGSMTQGLRVWCGVPTMLLYRAETPAQLQALADAWAKECRRVFLVASPPNALANYESVLGPSVQTPIAINRRRLERTVERKPHRYALEQLSFLIAPVTTTVSPTCPSS